MKFSQVVQGQRAERPITFEWRGETCKAALRPITGEEDGLALSRAGIYARDSQEVDSAPGKPLFDLGYMANVIALGFVDVESPEKARELFFRDAAEVLEKLDSELIQYLHARHEVWQQECSPTKAKLSSKELFDTLVRIVEADDDLPFAQLRPGTLWSLLRTTASLLLNSPEGKSQLSLLYDTTGSESKKKPLPNQDRRPS
jgi:hypothetical protein